MSLPDTNAIVRAHLAADVALTALVGTRIYCPTLPEKATLPAVTLFTRGGTSTPYIPDIPDPSVQINSWHETNPGTARQIYRAVYDALQGIQNTAVTIGGATYYILAAEEEVQGQDLIDPDTKWYKTMTFFRIKIR